jgi:hypothetical protein
VVCADALERAAAEQESPLAQREEADRGVAQRVDREDVAGRRGRPGAHLGEVLREQGADVVVVELAFGDRPVHRPLRSDRCGVGSPRHGEAIIASARPRP